MKTSRPLNQLAKKIREAKGVSLRDLARIVGCSHQTLFLWEQGRCEIKNAELLSKIEDALGIKPQDYCRESLSLSKTTVFIKKLYESDAPADQKMREFLAAAQKGIPAGAMDEILETIRRQRG